MDFVDVMKLLREFLGVVSRNTPTIARWVPSAGWTSGSKA